MSVCFGVLGDSEYRRLNISNVDGEGDDGDGEDLLLYEHQLNALIDHSVEEVFADENIVHHHNGMKGDNRPRNVEPVDHSKHSLLHQRGEFIEDEDGNLRLEMPYEDITSFGAGD